MPCSQHHIVVTSWVGSAYRLVTSRVLTSTVLATSPPTLDRAAMNAARRAREELVNSGKLRLFTGRERGRCKPLLGRRSTTNGMQGVRRKRNDKTPT